MCSVIRSIPITRGIGVVSDRLEMAAGALALAVGPPQILRPQRVHGGQRPMQPVTEVV